jgi:hypothetical protein
MPRRSSGPQLNPKEGRMSIVTLVVYDRKHNLLHEEAVVFGQGKHTDAKWVWENKTGLSFEAKTQPSYAFIRIDGVALFNVKLTITGVFRPGDTIHLAPGAITAKELIVD